MTLHTLTVITLVNIIAVCVERFRVINDDKLLHDMLADQMIYGLCDIDPFYLKVVVYVYIWFKTQIYSKSI